MANIRAFATALKAEKFGVHLDGTAVAHNLGLMLKAHGFDEANIDVLRNAMRTLGSASATAEHTELHEALSTFYKANRNHRANPMMELYDAAGIPREERPAFAKALREYQSPVALTEDDLSVSNFANSLEQAKWKNTLTKADYDKVEGILNKKGLLKKDAHQLERAEELDFKKTVQRIKDGEPITVGELNHLKTSNPSSGILLKADAPIHSPSGWGSALWNRANVFGHAYQSIANPFRWGEWGTLSRRLLAGTALATGLVGGPLYLSTADLEGIPVWEKNAIGFIRSPLDKVFDDNLEIYTGNQNTEWLADQDFDRLTANSGFRENAALTTRTKEIFGEERGEKLLGNINKAQSGTPEYWQAIIDIATELKTVQGQFSSPSIMYSYRNALAYTAQIPAGKDNSADDIAKYAQDKYIETSVDIFAQKNISPDAAKQRLQLFRDFTGNPSLEEKDFRNSLLKAYADSIETKTSDPLSRKIVKGYLLKTTDFKEEDLAEDKVRTTYKNLVTNVAEQQRTANFRDMVQGNNVTAPQGNIPVPSGKKPDINQVMQTLTEDNSFGLQGKREALGAAWNSARRADGSMDMDKLDESLKKADIPLQGRQVVESWAMQFGATR